MKKLFLLVLFFSMGVVTVACNGDDTESGVLTILIGEGESQTSYEVTFDLDSEVTLLELLETNMDVVTETTSHGPFLTAIDHLEATEGYYIGIYHNDAFASEGIDTTHYEDGDTFAFVLEKILASLTIEISDGYSKQTHWIMFDDDDLVSLKELLEANFDISYDSSEWGSMLTGIEDITTRDGNYIAIDYNGEFAAEGIDTTSFENGDRFSFTLTWWDQDLYIAYIIEQFMENHAEDYVGMHSIYVILGLHHYGVLEDYNLEMVEFEIDDASGMELVQAIVIGNLLDVNTAVYEAALIEKVMTDFLFSAALFNLVIEDEATNQDFLDALAFANLGLADSDSLNMVLLALDKLDDRTLFEAVHDAMLDNLYTGSYGINATNLAMAVIGTAGTGLNPDSLRYYYDESTSLIEQLLAYHTGDGSFYYQLDDESADLMFTTPQAFLALVLYASNEEINPFIFD